MEELNQIILLTTQEVATKLNVSQRTVKRLIQRGELPIIKIGRNIRIQKTDVFAFLARQKQYNKRCVGSVVHEKRTCHLNAMTVNIGGPRIPTQVENELVVLLVRPIEEKPSP